VITAVEKQPASAMPLGHRYGGGGFLGSVAEAILQLVNGCRLSKN
jgi:hypothetical protein